VIIRFMSSLGLGAALLAVPGAAGGAGLAGSRVPSQIRESVAYLVGTYHVGTADAMRRMRLQADKEALTRRLAVALPGEYAGGWLDQRHGGVLAVASTRPEHARRVAGALPHGREIRVRSAAYSLAELARIRRRVDARTGAYAQIDVAGNRVAVWSTRPSRVSRALAALGRDRRAVAVRRLPRQAPTACSFFECDPPIRAGISIGIGDKDGELLDYCTSAFNIRDNEGHFYAGTAGHCFTDRHGAKTVVSLKAHKGKDLVADTRWPGSVVANSRGPRRDFAFVRVRDTATWFPEGEPRNIDFFQCSTEHQPATCDKDLQSHHYRITGIKPYEGMSKGDIVCMSGASPQLARVQPGTRCGEITDLPDGGIRTNICAKPGDSGSPLFDQPTHRAYGIENSVDGDAKPGSTCLPADEQKTNYTALSVALHAANTSLRKYHLITD
jgi:streptogrisin C